MSLLDAGKGEALVNEIMSSKMHYFSHDNYNKLKERRAEDGSVTPELVAQYETKDAKNGNWSFGLSDEMEAFLEFKKATGGVIYQHVKVKITERNQEIDLVGMLEKTKYGKDGMGGIKGNGLMYVGYPR